MGHFETQICYVRDGSYLYKSGGGEKNLKNPYAYCV